MPKKKGRPRKTKEPEGFFYKGVKQVGDARYYNTAIMASKRAVKPEYVIGPGDIVDDIDATKRYTFYHFVDSGTEHSADEKSRLKTRGYFPCTTDRFKSATGRFEDAGEVIRGKGNGIWYACPYERYLQNREESREDAAQVANVLRSQEEAAKDMGADAWSTVHDRRGQMVEQ